MKFYKYDIVFKELPGHTALAFSVTGCPHGCEGCHSSHLAEDSGTELTPELYDSILSKYKAHISSVLFLGGEWCYEDLSALKSHTVPLKMAIYSGSDSVSREIIELFDIVKIGGYNGKPLDNKETNQRYYVKDKNGIFEDKTHLFWR